MKQGIKPVIALLIKFFKPDNPDFVKIVILGGGNFQENWHIRPRQSSPETSASSFDFFPTASSTSLRLVNLFRFELVILNLFIRVQNFGIYLGFS